MDEDIIIVALLSTLGLGMAAVVAGAWLPKRKELPDWLMAIGGTMSLVGFLIVVAGLMGGMPSMFREQWVTVTTFSGIALGVLLFSMGYVMDRWQKRMKDRELPGGE